MELQIVSVSALRKVCNKLEKNIIDRAHIRDVHEAERRHKCRFQKYLKIISEAPVLRFEDSTKF